MLLLLLLGLLLLLLRYRIRRRRCLRLGILCLGVLRVVLPVVRAMVGVLVGEDVMSLHVCDTACKPARVAF